MSTKLQGKVAIITGGASGIGAAVANLLHQQGATIVVCGRRSDLLAHTIEQIRQAGGEALAVVTDIRDREQIDRLVQTVLETFGQIDMLVNNAGVAIAKPVLEVTETEWNDTIDTNLTGAFMMCQATLPALTATQGMIVNVSSTLGLVGVTNFSAYCASKFGLLGLTEALADELKSQNVRVYAVCPGRTATEMQRQLGGEAIFGRSMPPEKVAARISGLVTGDISLASGKALVVDDQSWQMTIYELNQSFKTVGRKLLTPLRPLVQSFWHR